MGNYALDPHYHLPYVQVWNLDVQKTLPWNVVLNVGYNGSRGNHLDITSAPRASASSPSTDPTGQVFNYEQSAAFSKFNAGNAAVNKRLSKGISLGANYQYSHSIDDAGSVGGTSTVVAQNWQDLKAEEGNSSFDQRHKVSGTYLYELPFGKDKFWVTSGVGVAYSGGIFHLRQLYLCHRNAAYAQLTRQAWRTWRSGTAGTLRPNRVPGVSVTAGAGSLKEWFNPAAFTQPPSDSTTPNCPNCGNVSRNSDRRAGNHSEQYVALEDDATGRHAQHGVSRHGQQCLQHRAVRGRGHQRGFAELRAGDFGCCHAVVSIYGEVQVLKEQRVSCSLRRASAS